MVPSRVLPVSDELRAEDMFRPRLEDASGEIEGVLLEPVSVDDMLRSARLKLVPAGRVTPEGRLKAASGSPVDADDGEPEDVNAAARSDAAAASEGAVKPAEGALEAAALTAAGIDKSDGMEMSAGIDVSTGAAAEPAELAVEAAVPAAAGNDKSDGMEVSTGPAAAPDEVAAGAPAPRSASIEESSGVDVSTGAAAAPDEVVAAAPELAAAGTNEPVVAADSDWSNAAMSLLLLLLLSDAGELLDWVGGADVTGGAEALVTEAAEPGTEERPGNAPIMDIAALLLSIWLTVCPAALLVDPDPLDAASSMLASEVC